MTKSFENPDKQLAFSDFSASFVPENGDLVTVRACTGKRVVSVCLKQGDQTEINFSIQEAVHLRFFLGKALRMGFGMYAD